MQRGNLMIVGVGGQGSILATNILGQLFMAQGHDVKVSEVHGMSQRGGSVVAYLRFGERVYSPILDQGEADIIVSFEQLETARWLPYLKPGGRILSNTQIMEPMPVITGLAAYPADILGKIRALGVDLEAVDCLSLAEAAGSPKSVNLVLVGRLSTYFPDIAEAAWQEAIAACVKPEFLELNRRAFALGRER